MIELLNVKKSFNDREILKGIDCEFQSGKTNLIIGQSGSGKTVLLKSIVGLHPVDSGQILYDGRDLCQIPFKQVQALRQEIGMVFQGGALFDSLTVEKNVRFPLDMFTNLSSAEKNKRVEFCLDRVNLTHAPKFFPSEISGGMQKRVAIARAIALNPKYLFCDEPNSGLDPGTAIVIDRLIQEITEEFGITTIINTHDMNSVMEIGQKILFLFEGEKNWEGSSKEILHTDNEKLNSFVFASDLFKEIRDNMRKSE